MRVTDKGHNNLLEIDNSVNVDEVSSITITGNNNKIMIGKNTFLRSTHFIIESDDNIVQIGEGCRITGRYIQKIVNGNCIEIGDNTTFGIVYIICGEGKRVSIGKDCMFAFDISIRTTDSHAIIDSKSGERVNCAEDVYIGNHVWIAAEAVILKGSVIQDDSVVAMKSLVRGKFYEKGLVLGGIPAKVIKTGITWERSLLG